MQRYLVDETLVSLSLGNSYQCSKQNMSKCDWRERKKISFVHIFIMPVQHFQMKGWGTKSSDQICQHSVTRSLHHPASYKERLISIITFHKLLV